MSSSISQNAAQGHTLDDQDLKMAENLAQEYSRLTTELSKVIVGQDEVLKQVLLALFCRGHCL